MTNYYHCIRWAVHPLHTEQDVRTALRTLTEVASADDWSTLINYSLTSSHAHSNWAHWACRVTDRCTTPDEMSLAVASTLRILKSRLSGPSRRDIPTDWYRELFIMVPNPSFGTPGQKKKVRKCIGYVSGRSLSIKTFLAPDHTTKGVAI